MRLTGPKKTIKRARRLRSTMSVPERILWNVLRRKQTGLRFRRQHAAGPYVLDFYCFEAGLCVEIDGRQHDWSVERDIQRDAWLAEQGVRTLRVAARDIMENLEGVVTYIVDAAQAPSAALRAPPPPKGEG